ncbi:queuosine precursor transporter [Tepidibacillus infernus]|uniref:Probable queuosine precursor transporter n=1 Tax=Tepidibacillus decaturensis TaxID=1413211 RepID=A0A135L556_9BACI|nr:queuosine precursor transporter [Tepidibacillus decaturensis]KXG44106.1 transporter [Tepidibacillus decaturensis]
MNRQEKYFIVLSGLFTGLLVLANIIATKIITIQFGQNAFFVPAAVLAYALTFTITDAISEVWGKERTNWLVFTGFITSVISALLVKLAIQMPSAPFWTGQEAFQEILGSNLRITLAGMIAYLVSQYHDVWAFHFLKEKTKGRKLWLRNNVSTSVSQLLDTTIFITIAFYGVIPNLFTMILTQYAIKLMIAVLDTPVVYGLVYLIRNEKGKTVEEKVSTQSIA